jgi:putative hydrolase of the HAD superfamily
LPLGTLQKKAFDLYLLNQAITGKISDEDWRAEVTNQIQTAYPDSLAAEAVHQFTNKPAKIDDAVIQLLNQFRVGRTIYLITNATSGLTRDITALGLVTFFDGVINSSEVGIAKPEKNFFTSRSL